MDQKIDVLGLTLDELRNKLVLIGEKPFRANQIFEWISKGANSFEVMTNLSNDLIKELNKNFVIQTFHKVRQLNSSDGHTTKYLYLLNDNNIIECVHMEHNYGTTLCLSTQVGCRMGCSFCASTADGLIRNLTTGEMVAQILFVNKNLTKLGKPKISRIVLMGSGEPLDNYANTIKFMHLIHEPLGLNIGYRNITLSTCGLVPKIYDLSRERLNINLAISLHAPNDELRCKIMKVASTYSVNEIVEASKFYFYTSGRRVSFEYALIKDVNDRVEQAYELIDLLKGFSCHVNIIPLNENQYTQQKRSDRNRVDRFINTLHSANVNVTERREMGLDINGACGQLRASYLKKN